MAKRVSIDDVRDAYIKLKSYVYYENFSIGLKTKLAAFEASSLEPKLLSLVDEINNYGTKKKKSKIDQNINSISYLVVPKKFKDEQFEKEGFYFSNHNTKSAYEIDDTKKVTPFIDCSIELHIITILWIIRIGKKIDGKLGSECYGNRISKIDKTKSILNSQIRLFDRYYVNYNRWRDSAIKSAKKVYSRGKDVAILNLDLQSYYNSIDLNLDNINVKGNNQWLNSIVKKIHVTYSNKIFNDGIIPELKTVLPIGLISSNILANYYLAILDRFVTKRIRPEYYGRYVDDIIIVFSDPKINKKSKNLLAEFIESTLTGEETRIINGVKQTCKIKRVDDSNFSISINNNQLKFQLSKVKLYHLHKEESLDFLLGFEKEIKKNSSEFKFQLETSDLFDGFEDSSYEITYGDTVNKLRSIEKFNTNKFGASKHLSKLINGTKQTSKLDKKQLEKVSNKILTFFSGKRTLELVALWDKVYTFFVINKQENSIVKFSKHILQSIAKIKFKDPRLTKAQNSAIEDHLIEGLLNQLILSYAMAFALDVSFIKAAVINRLKSNPPSDDFDELLRDLTESNIRKLAMQLIRSNLFRQSYLPFPLVNYCSQKPSYSFASNKLSRATSFRLSQSKIFYSPRYISYNEVELFYYLQSIFLGKSMKNEYLTNRLKFVYEKYLYFNKCAANSYLKRFFPRKLTKRKNPKVYSIFESSESLNRIKVGIVNIKVNDHYTLDSLKGKPVLTFKRLDEIHAVLNEAIRTKCTLIIFPEICIPFYWLSRLTEFSKRNSIGIICGVEHFSNRKKEAFNYVATILPFKINHYLNSFLDLRLKIDYAPGEIAILKENGFNVPKAVKGEYLRIYKWQDIFFTVLNCFELTDIKKRIEFKGNVDFLVTVEFNKDVNYFSSINESLSRDLHCFMVQVNTSQYGDSRITLPSETITRDYIKLKGGENISLVTGNLLIKDLREFQTKSLKRIPMKKSLKDKFKSLPPNFSIPKERET